MSKGNLSLPGDSAERLGKGLYKKNSESGKLEIITKLIKQL